MPIEADQLDADTIKKIEDAVAQLPSNLSNPYKTLRVNGVPRQALLHPEHAEGRLQAQTFAVGDRVVYVQNSGKVDIAMKGTVVGINPSTLDVVWDQPIMSGTTLGGRCSENRGSVVPKSSVLNLTNPTVIALSKAALQRKPDVTSSGDNSRTASPAGHATRSQFHRSNGPSGRGGRGGKWYSPWGINSPSPNLSTKPTNAPNQGSPFNPTILLRNSQAGNPNGQTRPQSTAHLYQSGVAIPPPPQLDQRQRVRTGPPKPPAQTTAGQSERANSPMRRSHRGGANGFRGGRGGTGGSDRVAGAGNSSPAQSRRAGRGRGRGQHPTTP